MAEAIGQPYPIPNSAEAKSEIEQLFEKANELYGKKDYDAALPLLDRCLLLAENALGRDDPQVADVLFMIGRRLSGEGRLGARDPVFSAFFRNQGEAFRER